MWSGTPPSSISPPLPPTCSAAAQPHYAQLQAEETKEADDMSQFLQPTFSDSLPHLPAESWLHSCMVARLLARAAMLRE